MFDPSKPYNDLPFVSSIYFELTPELDRLREDTRVSIELLNYALKSLPNSEILLDTLALQEAKLSSIKFLRKRSSVLLKKQQESLILPTFLTESLRLCPVVRSSVLLSVVLSFVSLKYSCLTSLFQTSTLSFVQP